MAIQSHVPESFGASPHSDIREQPGSFYDQWLIPSGEALGNIRRVVVLVTSAQLNDRALLDKLRSSMLPGATELLFLGLKDNLHGSTDSARYLNRLVSGARTFSVAYWQLLPGNSWSEAVQKVARTGDMVVCSDMHHGAAAEIAALKLPVLLLSGVRSSLSERIRRAARQLALEAAPLLLIAGFFWLQVIITNQTSGFQTTVLTVMSVIFEFGLLFVWSLLLS